MAEPFLVERFGPVCSPTLLHQHPLERPEDLRQHTLLHTESRKTAWADWLRSAGVTAVDPTSGKRFETFYFMLQAAASGLGVAIGPHPFVAEDLLTGRLVAPFGFVPSGLSMYVLDPRARAHNPPLVAFRNWRVEVGAEDPA